MHNHVKVDKATSGHPDGTVTLMVYGKTVILTADEAREIAAELMVIAGPKPVPAKPVAVPAPKPVPPPVPPTVKPANASST
jgi:hypothetical protein